MALVMVVVIAYVSIVVKNSRIKKILKSHVTLVHGEQRINCDECDFKCTKPEVMRNHKRSLHAKTPADKYINCGICEKQLSFRSLSSHMKNSHGDQRQFECELCAKMFRNVNLLASHMTFLHGKKCDSKCLYCDRKFPTNTLLKTHVAIEHLG